MVELAGKPIEPRLILEKLAPRDLTIRPLNPENREDQLVARKLDLLSIDAIHPFSHRTKDPKAKHEAMTLGERKEWMKDRPVGMLRAVEASVVDEKTQEKKQVPIGFVYFYNDAPEGDADFIRRATEVRQKQGLSADAPVWEMNFYFLDDTPDRLVSHAVKQGLNDFAEVRSEETTTLMFNDAVDVRREVREVKDRWVAIAELDEPESWALAETIDQDMRLLHDAFKFDRVGRIRYEGDSYMKDLVYAKTIHPGQKFR